MFLATGIVGRCWNEFKLRLLLMDKKTTVDAISGGWGLVVVGLLLGADGHTLEGPASAGHDLHVFADGVSGLHREHGVIAAAAPTPAHEEDILVQDLDVAVALFFHGVDSGFLGNAGTAGRIEADENQEQHDVQKCLHKIPPCWFLLRLLPRLNPRDLGCSSGFLPILRP